MCLFESSILINFVNNIVAVPVSLFTSASNIGLFLTLLNEPQKQRRNRKHFKITCIPFGVNLPTLTSINFR
jgi:hypothetical protein